jgi:hypothetical protein
MTVALRLGVYRRLDNRFEGQSDDSPRALELHVRRKNALHAALDGAPGLHVVDWGDTDDSESHEFVELIVGFAGAAFTYAVVPSLLWLGKKLAEKAVDTAASEATKALISRLFAKQKTKEILDFVITLPDGTRISFDPPDRYATIHITFSDGKVDSINYEREKGGNDG